MWEVFHLYRYLPWVVELRLMRDGALGATREIFSLKIEVDTNPPEGAGLKTTVIRRYLTLQLQHHDQPSLLAGKIHAVLQRTFTSWRDLYDLHWYLSDPNWPAPSLILLNNVFAQTGWKGPGLTEQSWRDVLRHQVEGLKWSNVREDVAPFLERPEEMDLLTREHLLGLLDQLWLCSIRGFLENGWTEGGPCSG
jgi:hypothetical protein